jgi:hypothetical protein
LACASIADSKWRKTPTPKPRCRPGSTCAPPLPKAQCLLIHRIGKRKLARPYQVSLVYSLSWNWSGSAWRSVPAIVRAQTGRRLPGTARILRARRLPVQAALLNTADAEPRPQDQMFCRIRDLFRSLVRGAGGVAAREVMLGPSGESETHRTAGGRAARGGLARPPGESETHRTAGGRAARGGLARPSR